MKIAYLYLILTVVLTVSSQLLLKHGTKYIFLKKKLFIKSLFRFDILIALLLIIMTPFLYIVALSKINLSTAFIFMGLNYPLVTLGSGIFLKEKISSNQILAVVIIFIGFALFNLK